MIWMVQLCVGKMLFPTTCPSPHRGHKFVASLLWGCGLFLATHPYPDGTAASNPKSFEPLWLPQCSLVPVRKMCPQMFPINATRRCWNKWNESEWIWNKVILRLCQTMPNFNHCKGKVGNNGISRCQMAFMLQLTSTLEIYRFVPRLMLSHVGSSVGWGVDGIECSQGCDSKLLKSANLHPESSLVTLGFQSVGQVGS